MGRYEIKPPDEGKSGLALIINIKDFDNDPDITRKGSEKDVENLVDLFNHLNLEVILKENLKKDDFVKAICDFVDELENNDADLCFVCIMSHGVDGGKILAADNQLVDIEADILDRFKNKFCQKMIGKPKVFLFQACRGDDKDAGVMVPPGSKTAVTDSLSLVTEQLNDSFEAYSTTPHHVSYRNPDDGSPFIRITCQTIKKEAHKLEFQHIFVNIRSKLDEEVIYINEKQYDGSTVKRRRKVVMQIEPRLPKLLYLKPHDEMSEMTTMEEDISEVDAAKEKTQRRRKKSCCILL